MEQNKKNLSILFMLLYPLPALVPHFPEIPFTYEGAIGCINEASIGDNKGSRDPLSCFISCFTVSVSPSIDRL